MPAEQRYEARRMSDGMAHVFHTVCRGCLFDGCRFGHERCTCLEDLAGVIEEIAGCTVVSMPADDAWNNVLVSTDTLGRLRSALAASFATRERPPSR